MTCIVTNDDGIDAPGIEVLEEIAAAMGPAVVVAPAGPRSGVGHQVTVRSPIAMRQVGKNRFAIDGTPADCVRVALKYLFPDADRVLSGINPGANLGSDVYQSGTVAAAREAAILGRPAIAVSQYISKGGCIDWDITRRQALRMVRMLWDRPASQGRFWNVNLPHPLEVEETPPVNFCGLDTHPHAYVYRREGDRLIYMGQIHDRQRDAHGDVAACFGGSISVTLLPVGAG